MIKYIEDLGGTSASVPIQDVDQYRKTKEGEKIDNAAGLVAADGSGAHDADGGKWWDGWTREDFRKGKQITDNEKSGGLALLTIAAIVIYIMCK